MLGKTLCSIDSEMVETSGLCCLNLAVQHSVIIAMYLISID